MIVPKKWIVCITQGKLFITLGLLLLLALSQLALAHEGLDLENQAECSADVEGEATPGYDFHKTVLENSDEPNQFLEELSKISDSDLHLERTFLSPASLRALAATRRWMQDAGMKTWLDSVGNLHGLLSGGADQPTLLLGSHIDTVIDGGAYDGTLGIVTAISAVKNLKLAMERESKSIRRNVEVIAFCDEEGLRFKSTFLGSRAVSGSFLKHGYLHAKDSKGYELASVLENVGLSNSEEDIAKIAKKPEELYGYVEVHIEQGPVLESLDQPLGVVSAISAQTRLYAQVEGFSGHAGTVPMSHRKDSIATSAEVIHKIESLCQDYPEGRDNMLVCTVGEFNVYPGASNVIPGYSNFSIDVRCKDDEMLEDVVQDITVLLEESCQKRDVTCKMETKHRAESCQTSPQFMSSLKESILDTHTLMSSNAQYKWQLTDKSVPIIASGAGHDALAMSEVTPIGMLFVRCRDGISHSPLEFVEREDVKLASLAMYYFLRRELF